MPHELEEVFKSILGLFLILFFGAAFIPIFATLTNDSSLLLIFALLLMLVGILGMIISLLEAIRRWV